MEGIQVKDRERLRDLAKKQLEYANSPENDRILQKWQALAKGKRQDPTVRLILEVSSRSSGNSSFTTYPSITILRM